MAVEAIDELIVCLQQERSYIAEVDGDLVRAIRKLDRATCACVDSSAGLGWSSPVMPPGNRQALVNRGFEIAGGFQTPGELLHWLGIWRDGFSSRVDPAA